LTAETSAPVGDLAVALAHGARLLEQAPLRAKEQAEEILRLIPGQREAILLLGRALGAIGDPTAGAAAVRQLTARNPRDSGAWRALADIFHRAGDAAAADAAHTEAVRSGAGDPALVEAALALREGRLSAAETALRTRLKAEPTDVAAIRMLAEVAAQIGRYEDAANLLARCLELNPSFHEARRAYAQVLLRHERPLEALAQVDQLLALAPEDIGFCMLKAAVLAKLGDHDGASRLYEDLLARLPENPKGWMSYGHVLKTVGRRADGVAAYRRALAQAPQLGEAWWSLANLKTFRFDAADVATLRVQLARSDIDEEDRLHLHFALAKALEDDGDFAGSFEAYARGNAIRREQRGYAARETTDYVQRSRALFGRALFAERRGAGCPARDPIFIVGLPRSGSTLVEQILSSHSQVEGTAELADLTAIVRRLGGKKPAGGEPLYPQVLASLSRDELAGLGEEYLATTRAQRKTDRPLFIDKLPNNWMHVGLIQLILPNATIIDARRHPLACCLSGFKQHFARGQAFSYGLEDIGFYYRDYVALMAHFDAVLPGRTHRVIYERMVADTEGEVRRLLDHVGLAFEPACLEFWTNDRAVRTASSEQVRQPIFADAVEHWRNFEPWLDPLKAALGPVLDAYPDAPASFALPLPSR
jgi:predicted Zn-dependent protease